MLKKLVEQGHIDRRGVTVVAITGNGLKTPEAVALNTPDVIDAKIEGREVTTPTEEAPPKVVNLMEALRQSLERVSSGKKRAAKIADDSSVKSVAKTAVRKRARG